LDFQQIPLSTSQQLAVLASNLPCFYFLVRARRLRFYFLVRTPSLWRHRNNLRFYTSSGLHRVM
jgi:hypothetical protein